MPSIHPKANVHATHVRFGIQASGALSATIPTADLKQIQLRNSGGPVPLRAKLTNSREGKLFMEFGVVGALGIATTSKTTRFTFHSNHLNFKHGTKPVHAKTVEKIKAMFDQANPLILNFVEALPEKIQQRNKPADQELFKAPVVASAPRHRTLGGTDFLSGVTHAKEEFNRVLRQCREVHPEWSIILDVVDGELHLSVEL